MLRAAELPVSSLTTSFKAGLGPFCRYAYDLEVSEERSSDDHYESLGPSVKPAAPAPRSLGLTSSSACRGMTRGPSAACAAWVPAFLTATYFQPCERHRHHKKNECTFFCITCGMKPQSICQHCMGAHAGHQVIQVRRYVYCDVVRTCDINAYVDTTGVQNYIINSAKVMFLNHRPHSKIGRASGVDICRTCQRHLREGYSYCSLACKVEALTKGESAVPMSGAVAAAPVSPSAAAAGGSSAPSAFGSASISGIGAGSGSGGNGGACRMESLMFAAGSAGAPAGSSPRSGGQMRPMTGVGRPHLGPRAGSGGGAGSHRSVAAPAAAGSFAVPPSPDSAAAASYGGGGSGGGITLSSEPESSEPGDDTVLYGSASRAYGMYDSRAGGSTAGMALPRRSPYNRERDASGSASSEEDCCDFNFENPPKRRRSCLIGRRLSSGVGGLDAASLPPSAADAAAAAAAAATLLMPHRSPSGVLGGIGMGMGCSLSASGMLPEPPAPAFGAGGSSTGMASIAETLRTAASMTLSAGAGLSRRKQNAPQRAPSA